MKVIMNTTKYVPVHKFAKNKNTTTQNVYRWIREGKIDKQDIKIEDITVKRIRVREDLSLPKRK